ncbi:hypothetical protein EJ05DRAFT_498144 [Pseudovirgaria hyperparasitica]|uniref:Pheromone-regulated membrane protein n=1 Tax=Pseudovirgaria hyperparasitica TaxID=470096 RepID=A0A6A6WDC3_9PEZI|nr:uncharacterized protein EJ05DRAFT_498144 [Pseudovirgaria hyperparasitica]KAF2760179.1 hypothetical protein EJ05DRAFT_498144 [Pseudovirgaria hyperparasitica]
MGCMGRDSEKVVSEDQKWAYITLSDFRSKSCLAGFSYVWLWILTLISIGVYAADTFTAVNLLAFDRWSSQVRPVIPFVYAKWIFAGAIIFSFALLAFEWVLAIRALRRGGVVDTYMDPLAAIVQSIRPDQGQGFRRFLVLAELTKSKKGVNYIALFVYFQFKGAIRVIFAEGPRVVINAMTLWSVMRLNLIPEGEHQPENGRSKFAQFFVNIEALAEANKEQTVILSTMTFTLVIWAFEILFLFIALVLYLLFLWHHVPNTDGSLARYCRRKIESRLERIVSAKTQKAIAKSEAKRIKDEQKAAKKEDRPQCSKQPTLPVLNTTFDDDDTMSTPSLARLNSVATLPPYSSLPPTRSNTAAGGSIDDRQPRMPEFEDEFERSGMQARSMTQSSSYSAHTDGPLLSYASPMGYDEPGRSSPIPVMPPLERMNDFNRVGTDRPYSPMSRPVTSNSNRNGPYGGMRPPPRSNTAFSAPGRGPSGPMDGPPRSNTGMGRRTPGPPPMADQWSPYEADYTTQKGPSYEMSRVDTSHNDAPPRSLTPGGPPRGVTSSVPPQRSFMSPVGSQAGGYRSASAAPQQPAFTVASQRQQAGWHGGARLGNGQFRN